MEKQSVILDEINKKISEDGLTPASTEGEKLLHLWGILQKSKNDLQKALENEERLKKTQETEMKEVEDYVEHIRQLSDEREALIQELETENESLKHKSENKTKSSASIGSELLSETKEMLLQQGLSEIANSTTNEQIAFLLVERARLLDELESEHQQPTSSDADTAKELKQILEKERHNFDEQIQHHRASSTLFEEKLKSEHEEEIHCLMEENGQLEDDLADEQAKVKHLMTEMDRLKDELETEMRLRFKEREERSKDDNSPKESPRATPVSRPPSPARTSSDLQLRKIIEDKTKLEGELISLRSQVRTLENDKRSKDCEASKLKSDTDQVQMENERLQVKNSKLKSHLEESEGQLDEAETLVDQLTVSKDSLTKKIAAMEVELKALQDDAEKGSALQDIVDILNMDKNQLREEIESLSKRLESALSSEDNMNAKFEVLLCELGTLKIECEKLTEQNISLTHLQENQIKSLTSITAELETLKLEREELYQGKHKLVEDHKNMLNKVHQTQEQESTKQEIIIQHMRDQNQKLTNQLSQLQESVNILSKQEVELLEVKKSLEFSSKESEQRHEDETEDLKCKLQLTLDELGKSKTVIERMLSEKEELVNKLSLSDQIDEECTHAKYDLENIIHEKSDLNMRIKVMELKLIEKTQQANQFEEERNQRIELEKRICDLSDLETEIFTVREDLEKESRSKLDSDQKLQELVELLENQQLDHENIQLDFQTKVQSLEKKNEELQEDLFNISDELQAATDKADLAIQELEATKVELAERPQVKSYSVKNLQSAIPVKVPVAKDKSNKDLESVVSQKSQEFEDHQEQLNRLNKKIDEMTCELKLSKTRSLELNETVELYRSKLEQSELEIDSSHKQLLETQSNAELFKSQNEQLQKLVKNTGKDDIDSVPKKFSADEELTLLLSQKLELKQNLRQTQTELQQSRTTLHSAKCQHDELKQNNEMLEREILSMKQEAEVTQKTWSYSAEEKQTHINRITTLEEISRQLEMDNREMAKKLTETMVRTGELETQLEREKQRNSNNDQLGNRHTKQLEDDLDTTNKQIRTLREDLHQEQANVFRLEAENVGQKAKYDSIVKRLETEVSDMKEFHRKEMNNITNKLDAALTEAQELKVHIREKEQDIINQENETARMKSSLDRSEAQIETEIKLRSNVENRNKQQEQEMTKAWAQVRTMMEKCSNLENTKHCLEEELSRLMSSTRQAETIYIQKSASQEANITSLEMRAEQAERKNNKFQKDIEAVGHNLKDMEQKVRQSESSQLELEDKKDHIIQIKNQFESEKLQRTLLDQTLVELKNQLACSKQRENKVSTDNRVLQHSMLDLESQLNDLQEQKESDFHMHHHISESGKHNLMEQIFGLQKEVKNLQYELLSANETQEMHEKRYENRKLRTKEKLLKARAFYSNERSRLHDQMQLLDDELRSSRLTLRKEVEWRDKIDSNYKHVLHEKRDLITKLTEQEEMLRDQNRSLSVIQVRMKYMEEENSRLQVHIDSLNHQRITMEKISKTGKQYYYYESDDGTGDENVESNLENSLDSNGWTHDDMEDSQIKILKTGKSPRLGKYISAVVDLYQDESDEDQEFEA